MRLPRFRFTVRGIMILVIMVAIGVGGFEAGRRWEREHDPWREIEVFTFGHRSANGGPQDESAILGPEKESPASESRWPTAPARSPR